MLLFLLLFSKFQRCVSNMRDENCLIITPTNICIDYYVEQERRSVECRPLPSTAPSQRASTANIFS